MAPPSIPTACTITAASRSSAALSDGAYGAAAIDYLKGVLSAKKSTFYFDNEAVCLGAGITSTGANSIVTSMDQCLLRGTVTVKDSAGQRTLAGGDWSLSSLQWAHHSNVGYVFPSAVTGRLKNQAQSNSWNYINDVYPASEIDTKNVFALWVDHGAAPSNGSYQYIVVPETTVTALSSYAAAPPVSILSNTSSIQAVEHVNQGIVEAVILTRPARSHAAMECR